MVKIYVKEESKLSTRAHRDSGTAVERVLVAGFGEGNNAMGMVISDSLSLLNQDLGSPLNVKNINTVPTNEDETA